MQHLYNDFIATPVFMSKRILSMTPTQRITSYIDNLILEKGENYSLLVDALESDEAGTLASFLIDENDRDTQDCFNESDQYPLNDKITIALLKVLQNDSPENLDNLSTLIRNNVIKIYRNIMQERIDERCGILLAEKMYESGLRPYQHKDNGEKYWGSR